MNNIYAYSDEELDLISKGMPKVMANLPFLVAPVNDDQLRLINAFLLGGLLMVRREQKRRLPRPKMCNCDITLTTKHPDEAA